MNKSGIYRIKNLKNNRFYYGSSKDLKKREWYHFNNLKKNKHDNQYLQADYNKCGKNSFKFEIILICNIENLIFYEQKLLNKFFDNQNNCYNICEKAGNCLGKKMSPEAREKISKATKGSNNPMFGKVSAFRGKKHNDETKNIISKKAKKYWKNNKQKMQGKNNPFYGKKHSQKNKIIISEAGKDKQMYMFFNKEFNIKEFTKQYDLRKKYKNLKQPGLSALVKGRLKSYKNWIILPPR